MKKLTLMAGMFLLAFSIYAFVPVLNAPISINKIQEFMKKSDGTWSGKMDSKVYWYKLDKEAKLWWSNDGKKWAEVSTQMWADKSGNWMKIGQKKLWWSTDMGKTWAEVPEWKWEGPNGEWYKFDGNWNLWINK